MAKSVLVGVMAAIGLVTAAIAEGDPDAGAKQFNKCKACHKIESDEGEVIVKGGKTGPNLYGVIGRSVGSTDYNYGPGLKEAAVDDVIWSEKMLAAYVADPKNWLKSQGYTNKSKMSYKLRTGAGDVAAFLSSVGPVQSE